MKYAVEVDSYGMINIPSSSSFKVLPKKIRVCEIGIADERVL
jgi:hypothetical protein